MSKMYRLIWASLLMFVVTTSYAALPLMRLIGP
jgi:hypothetical protein